LYDVYRYGYPYRSQVNKLMSDWSARIVNYISFLKGSLNSQEGRESLDRWDVAFTSLEKQFRETTDSRNVGDNPVETARLIELAHQLYNEFTRFIQTHDIKQELIVPKGNNDMSQPDAETAVISSLENERYRNDRTNEEKVNSHPYKTVPIGGHTLPPLPYDYDALEPYIDEKTMRLHHDKHHKSYVEGLNKAEEMMAKARQTGDFELIQHWEREAAFNGAGHYLHTIFWNNMKPKGGGEPTGSLGSEIRKVFGSFPRFKKHFSSAAEKVEAVGWAILVWAPRAHRLEILQAEKHQNLSQWDVIPLLVLDVWEHAYYLKYQNDRKSYIEAWWNVVNWDYVNQRYEEARKLTWEPF
jgi:Fe-Mn family superoxide dismutase